MKEEPSKIKSDILLRVRLLYVLFVVIGTVVLLRLIWVQFSPEIARNARRLEHRIFSLKELPAQRGAILTRDGEPLATSMFRYRVEFDFGSEGLDSLDTFEEQSDSLSQLLALFFKDRTAAQYREMFRREHARCYRLVNPRDTTCYRSEGAVARFFDRIFNREFEKKRIFDTIRDHRPVTIFPRDVDYAEWRELSTYPLLNWNMGMVYRLAECDERIYPQGELARRTIGKVAEERKHSYGIEDAYREDLAGTDGQILRQRIARNFYGRVNHGENVDPENGLDVVTTLDLDLQDVADKALLAQLTSQNAVWGTALVMETATGEILAMANRGRKDIRSGDFTEAENYALGKSLEPGSTFKLASMLLLLEDDGMSPSVTYDTNNGDRVDVGPAKGKNGIRDSHRGDRVIDLRRAVAVSSNVYFARAIWDRYGATGRKEEYSRFLNERLHLGECAGLEMLGERKPEMAATWKGVPDPGMKVVKMSYGYRVRMTPLQILTFYNAVANDGRMIAPVLVRELRRNGKTVERFETHTIADRICSPATLRIVRDCLEAVCTEKGGTAARFFSDTTRFRVAAKTGTAQVTDPTSSANYLASMAAYFPAENPRYTVLSVIATRSQAGKTYYGASLAGPVVKRLVDYIYYRGHDWYRPLESSGERHFPQRIKGGDIRQIRRVADRFAPKVESDSRSGWGRVRVDSLSHVEVASLAVDPGIMPDVRGMGLKDALFLLENRGLRVAFSGGGSIVQQSVAPGSRIRPGTSVLLTMK